MSTTYTYDVYPDSMKNLTVEVREKAIDIANALLSDGMPKDKALPIAISQAEEWAKNRDKPVKQAK